MDSPTYRNEIKYLIPAQDRVVLSRQLEQVLQRDGHALGKGYLIRSLYFDTPDHAALRDNLMGASFREKFRIRCYNESFQSPRLEKKVKQGGKGYKLSAALTRAQVQALLQGESSFLKDHPEALLREFYCRLRTSQLKPQLIVSYYREPFLFPAGNVRVTLDYAMRYSSQVQSFFDLAAPGIPDIAGKCLVEVKFDDFLPDLIPALLLGQTLLRTAHSKYVTGRLLTL